MDSLSSERPVAAEARAQAGADEDNLGGVMGTGLSRTTVVSWSVGLTMAETGLAAFSTQILYYLTDFVGMPAALAATILAVAKASDILTDIVVGYASDRINTPWGRRRPWIFFGAILLAATVALLFNLNHLPANMTVVVCTIGIVFLYVGYTSIYVPIVAMSSEMVRSYKASGVLWTFGMFFGMIGTATLGTSGAAWMVKTYGGGFQGYNGMGLTLAAVILTASFIFLLGTRNAPSVRAIHNDKPPPIREWFASLVGNGPLIAYAASEFINWFGLSMIIVTMTYYLFDIVRLGQTGMIWYGLAGTPTHILAVFVVMWLRHRVPKHILAGIGTLASAFIMWTMRLFDANTGLVPFASLICVWGLFSMTRNITTSALVPDLIRADYLKTGLQREGRIAALVGAIRKSTPAIATIIVGFCLAASHYVSGARGKPQPQSAIDMLYLINCIIPGALFFTSAMILFFGYKLTEARMKDLEADAIARGLPLKPDAV